MVFVSMKGVLRLYEAYTALHGYVVFFTEKMRNGSVRNAPVTFCRLSVGVFLMRVLFLWMGTLFACMGRIRRLKRVHAKMGYCTVFFVKNIDLSGFL